MLDLTINGIGQKVDDANDLDLLISIHQSQDDLEIWVTVDGSGSLCALLNPEVGFLMFLPAAGDPGFTSRNPSKETDDVAGQSFRLSNGQVDTYPDHWTFDRSTIFAALSEFGRTGTRPTSVTWQAEKEV